MNGNAPSWIYPGAPVWARMGCRGGWSLAVVVRISRKGDVFLDFPAREPKWHRSGEIQRGRRPVEKLMPRNPELKGKDKPKPGASLASLEVN